MERRGIRQAIRVNHDARQLQRRFIVTEGTQIVGSRNVPPGELRLQPSIQRLAAQRSVPVHQRLQQVLRQNRAIVAGQRVRPARSPIVLENRFAAEVVHPVGRRREPLGYVQLEPQPPRRIDHAGIRRADHFATCLDGAGHHLERIDAPADALPAFEDLHVQSLLLEQHGGMESGEAGTDDYHVQRAPG